MRGAARYNRNVAVYQDVKKALQEILTPQVAELRGQMVDLRGEIAGLRGEMDSRFAKMDSRFAEMDTKFALLRSAGSPSSRPRWSGGSDGSTSASPSSVRS